MTETLPNGVVIDEQWDAVFYTKAADVPAMSGGLARVFNAITIHWWGDTTDFMTVVNTFCSGNKQTSAHYIAEAAQVACVVSPWDVAWACGNWEGNRTTISIECNPRGSDDDYATIASLIKYLRDRYGDLPLVPHNHWVATSCPGNYDLGRLDQLARGTLPTPTPSPQPIQQDEKMFLAKLANADAVYISNGIWYRWIQDPPTLNALVSLGVVTADIKTVDTLNVLGQNADLFNVDFARASSALGGNTNLGAVVTWFDSNMETLQNLIKAVPTVAGTPVDDNTIDKIAGRVADIFAQRMVS